MERIQEINYKGKKVLYGDHTGLSGKNLVDNVIALTKKVIVSNEKPVLVLSNFSDSYASKELMDYLHSEESKLSANMSKVAVVGIVGIKKLLLNSYNQITRGNTKAFDTEEQAKEWLVS